MRHYELRKAAKNFQTRSDRIERYHQKGGITAKPEEIRDTIDANHLAMRYTIGMVFVDWSRGKPRFGVRKGAGNRLELIGGGIPSKTEKMLMMARKEAPRIANPVLLDGEGEIKPHAYFLQLGIDYTYDGKLPKEEFDTDEPSLIAGLKRRVNMEIDETTSADMPNPVITNLDNPRVSFVTGMGFGKLEEGITAKVIAKMLQLGIQPNLNLKNGMLMNFAKEIREYFAYVLTDLTALKKRHPNIEIITMNTLLKLCREDSANWNRWAQIKRRRVRNASLPAGIASVLSHLADQDDQG